ncbi:unnamed protein product, partial [Ectocarpus fasciculatus]
WAGGRKRIIRDVKRLLAALERLARELARREHRRRGSEATTSRTTTTTTPMMFPTRLSTTPMGRRSSLGREVAVALTAKHRGKGDRLPRGSRFPRLLCFDLGLMVVAVFQGCCFVTSGKSSLPGGDSPFLHVSLSLSLSVSLCC